MDVEIFENFDYFCKNGVSREGHLLSSRLKDVLRNFERDGGRPTAYGVQAQFTNHFVRWKGN